MGSVRRYMLITAFRAARANVARRQGGIGHVVYTGRDAPLHGAPLPSASGASEARHASIRLTRAGRNAPLLQSNDAFGGNRFHELLARRDSRRRWPANGPTGLHDARGASR